MKTKRIILTGFALLIVSIFYAQTGVIEGTIVDSKGEEIPFANIVVETGISNTGVAADMNGHFRLKPLEAGIYNLKIIIYLGFQYSDFEFLLYVLPYRFHNAERGAALHYRQ